MKESDSAGLSEKKARAKLRKFGKNEITRVRKINPLKILISQFTSPLIIILVISAFVFFTIGFFPGQESNGVETILILLIVFVSGISGFLQEYKSEQTIEALQKMAVPSAKVIRDGKEKEIKVTKIVPGDLILLVSGDAIPADAKLIESYNLRIDESVLTGESKAITKKNGNVVYMHTLVDAGSAKALVVKTGMQTKVGEIAGKLQKITEEKTPFQEELAQFSKKISYMIAGVIVVVMVVSLFKYNLYLSLFIAISLSVAAIPEGLPAVVVLTLAVAAKAMSAKNALIRKLSVTESVGAVDIICTDKTGTLTKNEMEVTKLFSDDRVFEAGSINLKTAPELRLLLLAGLLCNNSTLGQGNGHEKKYIGDQTEVALRKLSEQSDLEEIGKKYKRVNELSFTSKRKRMSVVCKRKNKYFVFSKGAPEILIKKCNRIRMNGKAQKLDDAKRLEILDQNKKFATSALRILGFAYKETKSSKKGLEEDLIWLGLQAMIDPPREEVKEALKECKTAGIRVIILTGDNPLTTRAIAEKIGLKNMEVISGKTIDKLDDGQLSEKIESGVNIFARISPFHKLRVLTILKKKYRVAMTGDGVNDSLALKKADVGIAMGIRGTDVAKQASDMILLDDNFASIITAVKEGRRIFDNIRKFVNYLFTCNLAEVGIILLASLFLNLQQPILLPIQLLWINLLTDGLPALALGVDPARPDIMKNPPRKKGEGVISKRLAWLVGLIGTKKMIVLFLTFFLLLPEGVDLARSTLFTGFIFYEFVRIASIRSQEKLNWFSNKWILAALIGSVILQLTVLYSPINSYFEVVPLDLYAWEVLAGGIAAGYILAIIITKLTVVFVKA
jgi:Ca2+-transporting ATPase